MFYAIKRGAQKLARAPREHMPPSIDEDDRYSDRGNFRCGKNRRLSRVN
jgi:hypothetical protein